MENLPLPRRGLLLLGGVSAGRPARAAAAPLVEAAGRGGLGDRDGVTPLQHALRRRQEELAALLRAAGSR